MFKLDIPTKHFPDIFRGQQFAQQMQQANPELVEQLRSQMGPAPPGDDNSGKDTEKDKSA